MSKSKVLLDFFNSTPKYLQSAILCLQKHVSCLKCKENCQNVENTSSENKVVKTEIVDVVHNEAGSISDIKQEYEEKDPLCMLDDLKEESQTNETPYCNSFLIYQAAKYKCDICKIPFSTLTGLLQKLCWCSETTKIQNVSVSFTAFAVNNYSKAMVNV